MTERIDPKLPAGQGGDQGASPPLSESDVAELTDHLASLAKANLPLAPGLKALANDLVSSRLKKNLIALADELQAGVPLDVALAKGHGGKAPHLRGAVLAGLRTGQLGSVLEDVALHQRANNEVLRDVRSALAYPILVLGLLFVLLHVFLAWIVPLFGDIYSDFDLELPTVTILLIRVAAWEWPWVALAAAACVLVIAAIWIYRPPWLPGHLLIRLPLIGPLWGWSAFAEFTRLLGTLVRYDVPLPEALRLTADGVRGRGVGRVCRALADNVESGQSLAAGIAQWRVFPPSLVALIDWGQRTGSLSRSLLMAGDIYADRVRLQAAFVKAVLPPMILVLVLLAVSVMVGGLLVPLVDLIGGFT